MTYPGTAELKKKLRAEGFEIFRTLGSQVLLAERVRDNLIMDSGVAASTGSELSVRVVVRAQATHFPGADDAAVLGHAEQLASGFKSRGYSFEGDARSEMKDPSDPEHTLDTSFEITLRRPVETMEAMLNELRDAMAQRRYTDGD